MKNLARYLAAAAFALGLSAGALAQSQFSLASQPLNVANNIAPNVLFALSVEFPTAITPAYNWSSSATSTSGPYVNTNTYLGYFDPAKCYDYSINGTVTNGGTTSGAGAYSATTAVKNYFVPTNLLVDVTGDTALTNHDCKGAHWAGNFLNWVSMAGLDEFRYAMTGGNRIIDTTALTVLQRSYQTNQGGNFGEKQLTGTSLIRTATPLTTSGTWYFNSSGQNMQMNFGQSSGSTSRSVYVQVQVCNNSIGLETNCTAYTDSSGTTTYKPTGVVQNNSDSMRFSVFSYFNSNSIDNAVMRAKMKFTGQYSYNASGVQSANTFKEWDPATGIYVANPDSADTAITFGVTATRSGVVNYINQFGTGSTSANYKTYDNVSKLYYEGLAYLRKRTLDSAFYSGASTSNADNFPVITAYTEDPVQAYCQKNFIFMMGDTHTWCDKRLPGGSYSSTGNNQCNASAGVQADDKGSLSNGDSVNVTTWTNNISSGLATTLTGAGGASFYMSGLAFWAHTNDIRTDLNSGSSNKTTVATYIVDVQESQDIGINSQYWYAAKYGGFDTSTNQTTPTSSSVPGTSNWATYDKIYDGSGSNDGSTATGHGVRPKTYLPAGNPLAMISAVNSAFSQIQAAAAGDAAVTSSSGDLSTSGSVYQYQSTFTSVIWTGDLTASLVTVGSNGVGVSAPDWRAAAKITAGNPSASARVVLTYNDGMASYSSATPATGVTREGRAFIDRATATGVLSTAQYAALDTNLGGVTDNLGDKRINYLRGSRADEPPNASCNGGGGGSGGFRCRSTSLLGDIVHSQPAVVAAPLDMDFAITDPAPTDVLFEPGYLSFAQTQATRSPRVYVGANDGMLHGYNADQTDATNKGKEVVSYVPSMVYRNLSRLTSTAYAHTYYVDGSPRVASWCSANCTTTGTWKTALVGSVGAGGQGVFALDVTSPTFTQPSGTGKASAVMWEFTDRDDADMGYFLGKPVIAKMNNGVWAAIFGNGYNNSIADGAASTTGAGYLYIVFLTGPNSSGIWTRNTNYIKLTAGVTGAIPGTTGVPNGLGTPVAIDTDLNGTVDYIYAGDVYGNVWKFDVTSTTATSWSTGFSGAPMFTALDNSGAVQPITAGLGVSFSPYGGVMVNFGTGRYLATSDPNTTTQQTLYGVLDRNNGTKPPTNLSGGQPSFRIRGVANSLQQQGILYALPYTVNTTTQTVSFGSPIGSKQCKDAPAGVTGCATVQTDCKVNFQGTLTNNITTDSTNCPYSVNNPPTQLGWFFDLPNTAERDVEDRPVVIGTVQFTTLTPSGVACSGGLFGFTYILDPSTGGTPTGNVFDITGSGVSNAAQQYSPAAGVHFIVSGLGLPAGSTVNSPTRYNLGGASGSGTGGGAGGATALGCASGSTFIPGWGCVGGGAGGVGKAASCTDSRNPCQGLFLPGQKNRLYWRQLFTQ